MNQKFMVTGMDSEYSEILAYPLLTLGDHQKMLMLLFFLNILNYIISFSDKCVRCLLSKITIARQINRSTEI